MNQRAQRHAFMMVRPIRQVRHSLDNSKPSAVDRVEHLVACYVVGYVLRAQRPLLMLRYNDTGSVTCCPCFRLFSGFDTPALDLAAIFESLATSEKRATKVSCLAQRLVVVPGAGCCFAVGLLPLPSAGLEDQDEGERAGFMRAAGWLAFPFSRAAVGILCCACDELEGLMFGWGLIAFGRTLSFDSP